MNKTKNGILSLVMIIFGYIFVGWGIAGIEIARSLILDQPMSNVGMFFTASVTTLLMVIVGQAMSEDVGKIASFFAHGTMCVGAVWCLFSGADQVLTVYFLGGTAYALATLAVFWLGTWIQKVEKKS